MVTTSMALYGIFLFAALAFASVKLYKFRGFIYEFPGPANVQTGIRINPWILASVPVILVSFAILPICFVEADELAALLESIPVMGTGSIVYCSIFVLMASVIACANLHAFLAPITHMTLWINPWVLVTIPVIWALFKIMPFCLTYASEAAALFVSTTVLDPISKAFCIIFLFVASIIACINQSSFQSVGGRYANVRINPWVLVTIPVIWVLSKLAMLFFTKFASASPPERLRFLVFAIASVSLSYLYSEGLKLLYQMGGRLEQPYKTWAHIVLVVLGSIGFVGLISLLCRIWLPGYAESHSNNIAQTLYPSNQRIR